MPRRFFRWSNEGVPEESATVRVAEVRMTRGIVGEEGLGEELGDVDGCGLQVGRHRLENGRGFGAGGTGGVAEVGGGAALDPEDGVGVGGFEEEFEMGADVGGTLAQAGGFFDVADAVELAFEPNKCVDGAEVGVAVGLEEVGAVRELHAAWLGGVRFWQRAEEEARALADGGGGAFDGGAAGAFGAEHRFGVAGELVEAVAGERDAEVLRGDVFELVGFVEDYGGGFGEDSGIRGAGGLLLDGEVGEEEVMVDDDEVGLERLAAHLRDEAGLPVGAGLAEADFAAGVELVPERGGFGEFVDVGAVTSSGGALPLQDGVELRNVVEAGEDGIVAEGVKLLLAEVVGAALHVADSQRAEQRFEERDVLEEELLLQIFCAGGDDDALLLVAGAAERGEKVGEGFAGAGAGFDDEMALVGEGLFDRFRHGVLAGAVLEGEGGAGQEAAGREEVVEGRKLARRQQLR